MSAEKQLKLDAFNAQQDAIELVTVNGYPFAMLNSSGMRGFIETRLQAIRSAGGHAVPINRYDIVNQVARESDRIKNYIAAELSGKIFSLMFDVCTIATLSMLGVNVTYMKGAKVACHSLGTIKIDERHTGVNMAAMLYDILDEYQLSLKQVFSVTTDTAKNATATSEVLNLVANSKENENDIAEESIFDTESNSDEFDFGLDIKNEAELQKIIENMAAHTQLVNEMVQSIGSQNTSIMQVNHVNCGTHVLQLAIKDTLDETDADDIIKIVHDMCVVMRTQIVMIAIRKIGSKVILPPLDNATRWNSKFIMVYILNFLNHKCNLTITFRNNFFQCRDFLKMKEVVIKLAENKEFGHKFEVNETFWIQVEEIVNVLQSGYDLTIDMQQVGYGLSEFYIGWLRMKRRFCFN